MSMTTSPVTGSSVSSPAVPADFETQWKNLVSQLAQMQRFQTLVGAVLITNGNTDLSATPPPIAPTPPSGPSAGVDPVTGQPLPGAPPIILQQGVFPVANLTVKTGAYMSDVYADVSWEVAPASNAIQFEVIWGTVTGGTAGTPQDSVAAQTLALNPAIYLPLNDSESVLHATNLAAGGNFTVGGDVTFGVPGSIPADPSQTAAEFDGVSGILYPANPVAITGPQSFSLRGSFKIPQGASGGIIQFSNSVSGVPSSYDRAVYVGADGKLAFTAGTFFIFSTSPVNDGQWHRFVATLGTAGMTLYVDDVLVASSTNTSASSYSGYWRVGHCHLSGYTDAGSEYWPGMLDQIVVDTTPLSAAQVQSDWQAQQEEGGTQSTAGNFQLINNQIVSGNSCRLNGLLPNTLYGVQVVASNILGQSMATPAGGYYIFETTSDTTVPPAVSLNGPVQVGAGATSVIVQFQPLTIEQAADVAMGNGTYLVEITNDPSWNTISRQVYTGAWVVAFNDVYPHTTLAAPIGVSDAAGVSETFVDLSQVTPGAQFTALIDDEYIIFNAPSGNTATIAQRNAGSAPLTTGPEAHATGAKVTFSTQTTWYARVAALDASGNQGPWTYSTGMIAGGVTDSMIVGDISAAHITFGLMQGNRIEVNSLQVGTISSGTISTAQLTLNGGALIIGNPPTNGIILNSQGITAYSSGSQTFQVNGVNGNVTLTSPTVNGLSTTNPTITIGNPPSTGIQINSSGITAYSGGSTKFNLNASTGAASFSGDISGATGTFGGTIDGTVTGAIINNSTANNPTINSQTGKIVLTGDTLTVYDGSGNRRISLGYLSDIGDYGIEASNPAGTITSRYLPTVFGYYDGVQNVASSGKVGIGPSVTAFIGASGDALITVSADIVVPSTSADGAVYIYIGFTPSSPILNAIGCSGSFSKSFSLKQYAVSQGASSTAYVNTTTTFGMFGSSGNSSTTVTFQRMSITVQPI